MAHQLTPSSGREDEGLPRPRTESNSALTGCFEVDLYPHGGGLRVRPSVSDPGRMLGWVLLIVAATVVIMPVLLWWLV